MSAVRSPATLLGPRRGTVSHHLLRRTARAQRARLARSYPQMAFVVRSALRGPFGWRVERVA